MQGDITADTALDLIRSAAEVGAASVLTPERGRAIGFDTGLGARQDTRAFVHALIEGFAAGTAERHALAEDLTREREAG